MIGWFTVKDKKDAQNFCVVASDVNAGLVAKAFIPPLYRDSVSTLNNGDKVFCVIDDASGFGAILFKQSDAITDGNALNLTHDLHVSGKSTIDETLEVNGNITTKAMLAANTNVNLTAAHTASILASALSGVPVILPMTVLSDT